jgi:hypothetical protein
MHFGPSRFLIDESDFESYIFPAPHSIQIFGWLQAIGIAWGAPARLFSEGVGEISRII